MLKETHMLHEQQTMGAPAGGAPAGATATRVRRYSVKSLAESHGIGMRQLQRIFRRERGVSPKKFLESQRLEEARGRLLKGDGLKVIAEELGYCDVPHLSRAFRRFYGIGPADYRRRARMSPSDLPQCIPGVAGTGLASQAPAPNPSGIPQAPNPGSPAAS